MNNYSASIVNWKDTKGVLMKIREDVFVHEQNVSIELEHDPMDVHYTHALALDNDSNPIGTGRLLENGKIGRMAVLKSWRGHGVGIALLDVLTNEARNRNLTEVKLGSQVHAQGFYACQGFSVVGEEYMEAGIAHINMKKTL